MIDYAMIINKIKSKRLYSFLRDPFAVTGAFLMVVFILAAIAAPVIAPMDPYDLKSLDLADSLLSPAWMESGSKEFLLGTDDQGRGILSTILYGLRTSLVVGFSVVIISSIIGITLGMIEDIMGEYWILSL